VVNGLHVPCLVGSDFMDKHGISIVEERRRIEMDDGGIAAEDEIEVEGEVEGEVEDEVAVEVEVKDVDEERVECEDLE
jgi:hypothetical protein